MDMISQDSVGLTEDDASKLIDSNKPYDQLLYIFDHISSPKTSRSSKNDEVKNDDDLNEASSSRTATKTRGSRSRTRGRSKTKDVAEFQSNLEENSNSDETPLPPKKKKKPRVKNQITLEEFIVKNKK